LPIEIGRLRRRLPVAWETSQERGGRFPRIAISNRRPIHADAGPGRFKTMTLATQEFIRRFLVHALPKRFHRMRGSRGRPPKPTASAQPLPCCCPRCGGRMVVADHAEHLPPAVAADANDNDHRRRDQLHKMLRNDDLVRKLTEKGPPFLVMTQLTKDPATPSGLRWTSSQGPDATLTTGTLLDADVETERVPAISLVIPELKEMLRSLGQQHQEKR
jgi:hypothetical protein